MLVLKKITIKELAAFVSSDAFLMLKYTPISKARALSYLKNPRASKEAVVLYMAFLESNLVGYRTVLPDVFYIENNTHEFGWLSGNWVAENYRRKGVSTFLFNEVIKDWQGKLMYSNYAEASKLVYDKTERFSLLETKKGVKFYIRFCLADILPKKTVFFKKTTFLWRFVDVVLNRLYFLKDVSKNNEIQANFTQKINQNLSDALLAFLSFFTEKNLFKRSGNEFKWINKYPWVLEDASIKEEAIKYHFSSYSKQFESNNYTLLDANNRIIAFVVCTLRNGHVKVPYAYFLEENKQEVAGFILDFCTVNTAKTLLLYQEEIVSILEKKASFITKKTFSQKFFCTSEIKKMLPKNQDIHIQTGDGDSVFT